MQHRSTMTPVLNDRDCSHFLTLSQVPFIACPTLLTVFYLLYSINFMLHKRSLFAFQENAGFDALQAMPHVLWYIHAVSSTILTDNTRLQNLTVIVIGCHPDLTLQNHKGLCFCGMMVYWYLSARFQCVEETMALVLKALMEVVVHSQSWGLLRFIRYLCK